MFSITAGKTRETLNVVHRDGRVGVIALVKDRDGCGFQVQKERFRTLEDAAEAALATLETKASRNELYFMLGGRLLNTLIRYRRVDGTVDETEIRAITGFKNDLVYFEKADGHQLRSIKIGNLLGVKTSDGWYVTE